MKKAFTFIELIFSMAILSIVAYVASSLIAKTYIGYNRANTFHKANIKVELALNIISNRLSYAIYGTIVKRKSETDSTISSITVSPFDYKVLEWVGSDVEGFEAHDIDSTLNDGTPKPQSAWSGFCNIKSSSATQIITPGSDLTFARNLIEELSAGKVSNLKGTAIFFPENYSYNNIGYSGTDINATGVAVVDSFTASLTLPSFNLDPTRSWRKRVTEHYKLAWSAYSIVPINYNATTKSFDLELRYNYRPWLGEQYNSPLTSKTILASNISVFKTYATENRVHIKLCVKEKIGFKTTDYTTICKEKVVFK